MYIFSTPLNKFKGIAYQFSIWAEGSEDNTEGASVNRTMSSEILKEHENEVT